MSKEISPVNTNIESKQTEAEFREFEELVSKNLFWDSHAGIFPAPDADLSGLLAWRDADVNYVSINVGFDVIDWQTTFRTLVAYRYRLVELAEFVSIISSVEDILTAKREKKLAVSFDIEGANALDGDLAMVSALHDLGVRQMLLAYNLGNMAAGGCHDIDAGLTTFGREVVKEMNQVGMIVDCSHVSHRASIEMMEISSQPVVFTHSNPVAIWPHGRNILDDQIRKCAVTGGVVGINGMGIFLGENDTSDRVYADHACYVADLVGPAHVGIGLDYKPPSKTAESLGAILQARPDYWPSLTSIQNQVYQARVTRTTTGNMQNTIASGLVTRPPSRFSWRKFLPCGKRGLDVDRLSARNK